MSDYTSIVFVAEIKLDEDEIAEARGDFAQAIQNEIGHTGAVVLKIESDQRP